MFTNKTIGIIGAGAMAEALLKGFLSAKILNAQQCIITDVDDGRLACLAERYQVNTLQNNCLLAGQADILILAVKPQVMRAVLSEIKPYIRQQTLLISIAAGITLKFLTEQLGTVPLVRVMPNTPVAVGTGMSIIAIGGTATSEHEHMAISLFATVGKAISLKESLFDSVTGLSGSGPGYVFMMLDALTDAGVYVGLPRPTALLLAAQTFLGAAQMVLETGEHPAKLRDMVTSPAGTTIAGITKLEQNGVRAALIEAVATASSRSAELESL